MDKSVIDYIPETMNDKINLSLANLNGIIDFDGPIEIPKKYSVWLGIGSCLGDTPIKEMGYETLSLIAAAQDTAEKLESENKILAYFADGPMMIGIPEKRASETCQYKMNRFENLLEALDVSDMWELMKTTDHWNDPEFQKIYQSTSHINNPYVRGQSATSRWMNKRVKIGWAVKESDRPKVDAHLAKLNKEPIKDEKWFHKEYDKIFPENPMPECYIETAFRSCGHKPGVPYSVRIESERLVLRDGEYINKISKNFSKNTKRIFRNVTKTIQKLVPDKLKPTTDTKKGIKDVYSLLGFEEFSPIYAASWGR